MKCLLSKKSVHDVQIFDVGGGGLLAKADVAQVTEVREDFFYIFSLKVERLCILRTNLQNKSGWWHLLSRA